MSLPLLNLRTTPPQALLATLREHGAMLATDPALPPELGQQALADAATFFALSEQEKAALSIERSPHFRGYSRMHNERDWREQVHFGPERPAADAGPEYLRLQGPNQWPNDKRWRARMQRYHDCVTELLVRVSTLLAGELGQDARHWLGSDPYVLLKCIGYHAQTSASATRRGVAAHLDFSLLTLTLQDDVGGLEVRRRDGQWVRIPPRPGTWLLHLGELLPYVAGADLVATPHRVVNPSLQRLRCSLPVFLAPSLATTLTRAAGSAAAKPDAEHVHSVLEAEAAPPTLHYGEAEARRKIHNVWCARCCDKPDADRDE